MPLDHFASQVREKQACPSPTNPSSDNSAIKAAIEKPAGKSVSSQAHTTQSRSAIASRPVVVSNDNNNSEVQAANHAANPSLREIPLTWSDQQMLCAMSAMQIRYGRPAEAIPYLMMIRKINPKNVECARLLALSFMRLERWQEAEIMVEEYDTLQKSQRTGVVDGLVLLYRSLVSYKTSKIAEAKSWFGKFRKFNRVS